MKTAEFYASVCGCSNTSAECPGIINSRATGWIPRGFLTAASPPVKLFAVCKNPGHPLNDEPVMYRDKSAAEIATAHLRFASRTFKGDSDHLRGVKASTRFHKNLVRYLAFFLDLPAEAVFQHVLYTNLVKCSTVGERDQLQPKTMNECFTHHLLREIAFFQPKVLLAFGREVERFLIEAREQQRHMLPVVYIKHPSYFYRKDIEHEVLVKLKTQIQLYLSA